MSKPQNGELISDCPEFVVESKQDQVCTNVSKDLRNDFVTMKHRAVYLC